MPDELPQADTKNKLVLSNATQSKDVGRAARTDEAYVVDIVTSLLFFVCFEKGLRAMRDSAKPSILRKCGVGVPYFSSTIT